MKYCTDSSPLLMITNFYFSNFKNIYLLNIWSVDQKRAKTNSRKIKKLVCNLKNFFKYLKKKEKKDKTYFCYGETKWSVSSVQYLFISNKITNFFSQTTGNPAVTLVWSTKLYNYKPVTMKILRNSICVYENMVYLCVCLPNHWVRLHVFWDFVHFLGICMGLSLLCLLYK